MRELLELKEYIESLQVTLRYEFGKNNHSTLLQTQILDTVLAAVDENIRKGRQEIGIKK